MCPKAKVLCLALGLTLVSNVYAQALTTPEQAIAHRQQNFETIQENLKLMNAMLRGKQAFDQATFANSASQFADSASVVLAGFEVAGSDQGDTKAKPVVWQRWDDFEARMIKLQDDAQHLAAVAQGDDRAELRQAFASAAKNCKACHQTYRYR